MGCNEGAGCGAGDVAGVSLGDGLSENEMDDGLEGTEEAHHSVRISDSNMDNIMTLYRLRRASGRPPDCT